MRLPAITVKQQQNEDARQFHERLYAAYLGQTPAVLLPCTSGEAAKLIWKLNDSLQRFWRERGFRLRFKASSHTVVTCWLEARPQSIAPTGPSDLTMEQVCVE